MNTRPTLGLLSLLCFLFPQLASAGLGGGKVHLLVLMPPEIVVEGVQNVHIADFEGLESQALTSQIRAALINGNPQIDPEMRTLKEGIPNTVWHIVDGDADLIISGKSSVSSVLSDYQGNVPKEDADGNVMKDKEGNTIREDVDCFTRTTTVLYEWTATKSDSSPPISGTATEEQEDRACGVKPIDMAPENLASLNEKARARVIHSHRENEATRLQIPSEDAQARTLITAEKPWISKALLPHWEARTVDLDTNKSTKDAVSLIVDGRVPKGACILHNLLVNDSENERALYDLGAAMEVMGHYKDALDAYRRASANDSDKGAAKAKIRVRQRIKEVERLAKWANLTLPDNAKNWSNCKPVPKGKLMVLKKDSPLLKESNSKSGDNLDKGLTVVLIKRVHNTSKVATLDGRQGYVLTKNLK